MEAHHRVNGTQEEIPEEVGWQKNQTLKIRRISFNLFLLENFFTVHIFYSVAIKGYSKIVKKIKKPKRKIGVNLKNINNKKKYYE